MGRRSINTTKSGKYMNPTDQARKEARKKELKKNKKQRQMVRAAVLKGKDPVQIIAEMEKIDQMEYNVLQAPPLNEKVLKDKRKKLKETLDRVLTMYDKDDPEKWADLKRMEVEYEKRRMAMVAYMDAVRYAQQVQVDEIPLPALQLPHDSTMYMGLPSQIPLPTDVPTTVLSNLVSHSMMPVSGVSIPSSLSAPPPHGILKKTSAYVDPPKPKKPPGVPKAPVIELSDDEGEGMDHDGDTAVRSLSELQDKSAPTRQRVIRFADDESSNPGAVVEDKDDAQDATGSPTGAAALQAPKPTTLQQKMLAMAGQDIDQFMKEMEEVHRKREQDRAADLTARLSMLDADGRVIETDTDAASKLATNKASAAESDLPQSLTPQTITPPGTTNLAIPPPSLASNQKTSSAASQTLPTAPALALNPMMFRPPPLRPGVPPLGIRLPPGPPPGRPGVPPGPPPGLPRMGLRLPPGPPPGMPPRMLRPPGPPPRLPSSLTLSQLTSTIAATVPPVVSNPNVLTAAPQLINRDAALDAAKKPHSATIEAKPQIRNLSADVTRFLPTALRVKREDVRKKRPDFRVSAMNDPRMESLGSKPPQPGGQPTKDDAYMQFMREMEGLL